LLGEDSSDEVWGRVMEVEADLYLVKPLRYRGLVARIKAILRRYKKATA
jgi:DNA-binding response OmpR family regulator